MAAKVKIKLPQKALNTFYNEARRNACSYDTAKETLCYFLGDKSDDVAVDTIIFPAQTATSTKVDDEGNYLHRL